nr:addiction module protein [uncultured Flavobacterium sp.]
MESINLNINLTVEQLIQAVKQLSPQDKIKLNDALWDQSYEVPESHKAIVFDRIAKAKANPERLLDWDEVSKTL